MNKLMSDKKSVAVEDISRRIYFASNRRNDYNQIKTTVSEKLIKVPFITKYDVEDLER
jgi:hypothetical protein